jgi:hypothetical protein
VAQVITLEIPLVGDKKIIDALLKYGYTHQQITAHLMHYATISN